MVQIWEKDPFPHGDPRLPHHCFPPRRILPDELYRRTGTHVWQVDLSNPVAISKRVTTMKLEHNFHREDMAILDGATIPNFEDKIASLFALQVKPLDEARLILAGEAYFDIHDIEHDRWYRILAEPGDLILIPRQTACRFTTSPKNYVKMKRYYKNDQRA